MAVTPKGIVTPDPSSPYNLITDLNTLASTTDAAIATQKGTAAQRTAATAGASAGTLWQDTDGIKMLWRKDGAAWVPAVWRWGGTTAQMNSFTQAPDGFKWHSSSNNAEYVRMGGSWHPTYLEGTFDFGSLPANGGTGAVISFPSTFPVIPSVSVYQVTPGSNNIVVVSRSVSSSGFTAVARNFASTIYTPTGRWVATI